MSALRVLLVCACFEPGRDGVGDYVRQLALRMSAAGVDVRVLAVNDRFVSAPATSDLTDGIQYLRLPTHGWTRASSVAAKEYVDSFSPDWVSLQIVSWSFGWRGVISRSALWFKQVLSGRNLQLMFHETWLGFEREAPLVHKLWGQAQRLGIRWLCAYLRPSLVTTTNGRYAELLEREGLTVAVVPLASNIPVVSGCGSHVPDTVLRVVFFGSLWSGWAAEALFRNLCNATLRSGRRLELVQLGGAGPYGRELFERLEMLSKSISSVEVKVLGPQDERFISEVLGRMDLGVSCTPAEVVGKSSAVATMIDHGLPVLLVRGTREQLKKYAPPSIRDFLHVADGESFDMLRLGKISRHPCETLPCPAKGLLGLFRLEKNAWFG